jgi:hypothetical protein
MTSAENNSLLSHFLLRLQKDITRIDNLIQAVYNGQSVSIEIDPGAVVCGDGADGPEF